MRPRSMFVIGAVALTGCVHAASTAEAPAAAADDAKRAASVPVQHHDAAHSASTVAAVPVRGASANPADERPAAAPGRPQLSNSPAGLMRPAGPRLIQQALAKKGYLTEHESGTLDDETSSALRKFQGDEHLARTGSPDRDTVRRLGLSPDDVFVPPPLDARR